MRQNLNKINLFFIDFEFWKSFFFFNIVHKWDFFIIFIQKFRKLSFCIEYRRLFWKKNLLKKIGTFQIIVTINFGKTKCAKLIWSRSTYPKNVIEINGSCFLDLIKSRDLGFSIVKFRNFSGSRHKLIFSWNAIKRPKHNWSLKLWYSNRICYWFEKFAQYYSYILKLYLYFYILKKKIWRNLNILYSTNRLTTI